MINERRRRSEDIASSSDFANSIQLEMPLQALRGLQDQIVASAHIALHVDTVISVLYI